MELKLFLIGLKIQWRSIRRSKWQILGIIGAILILLAAVLYGLLFAQILNHPEQLPPSFPKNIREIFLTAIVGAISLVFVMRNFVPSVKEKVNVIPSLAPVSTSRIVFANLILDITKPAFFSLLIFLSTFSIALNTTAFAEIIYLWGSFFTFWLFSHSMLTLIHHRLNSPFLYAPILIYALPFVIPSFKGFSGESSLFLIALSAFSMIYLLVLDHFSELRLRENGIARNSDVNKMLSALSIKEKKMRTLSLIGIVIKLALAAFVFLMQKKASIGEELGIMAPIYEVFLLAPIIVANYFLANLWGMNPALWIRLNESGANIQTYFSVYWKVSKIPFLVEFVFGFALYLSISDQISLLNLGLAVLAFPMLLFSSFYGSLWFPKKIVKVMSFSQGNSVAIPATLMIVGTLSMIFLIRLDILFALGVAAIAWIQWEGWKQTDRQYRKQSPKIFEKLK